MTVTLEPWEYEHACGVGIRRFTERWGSENAKHYIAEYMQDDRSAQVAAAICELAVAKHLNQYWSGHVWKTSEHSKYKLLADVGNSIEVRRVRSANGVAVREGQLGQGLVLWAAKVIDPEYRDVELLGWVDYDHGWNVGSPSSFSATTRYIDLKELNNA